MFSRELVRRAAEAVGDGNAVGPYQELDVRDDSDVASLAGEMRKRCKPGVRSAADYGRRFTRRPLAVRSGAGRDLAYIGAGVVVREDRRAPVWGCAGRPQV